MEIDTIQEFINIIKEQIDISLSFNNTDIKDKFYYSNLSSNDKNDLLSRFGNYKGYKLKLDKNDKNEEYITPEKI